MAKAQITAPDGTTIRLTGTPDEIAEVLKRLRQERAAPRSRRSRQEQRGTRVKLVDLIESMLDGDFFRKPKDLPAVKAALEELGHHYPMTTLSGAMLRQVRRRNLRRIKREKRWFYTR